MMLIIMRYDDNDEWVNDTDEEVWCKNIFQQ
jgi:hypothetical protein